MKIVIKFNGRKSTLQEIKIKNLRLTLRLKIRTRLVLGFRIKSENTLNKIKIFDF